MFNVVIVVFKRCASIIRWINVYTFDCAREVFFEGAECEQVVPVDKHITRPRLAVGQSPGFNLTIGECRVFDKYAWFYGRTLVILPYPRQFQFI